MERHLFLTGEIGAGKSTAITAALGDQLPSLGGFRTCRNTGDQGRPASFSLETPDGSRRAMFLDLSADSPRMNMDAFETLGIASLQGERLLLDEIGGIELLSPAFLPALEEVLRSPVPILGVIKGKHASRTLAAALGLTEAYRKQAEKFWDFLSQDENTRIYSCEKYDEKALNLVRQWVREYCL